MSEDQRVPSWLATATAYTWRGLILLIGATVFLAVVTRLYLVTLPVFIALILATLAAPPARWLQERGFRPAAAAATVLIGGVGVFGAIIAALTPAFVSQVQELGPTVSEALNRLLLWAEEGPLGWDRAQIENVVGNIIQTLQAQAGQLAGRVVTGAVIVAEILIALVLALVLLFFFIKDGEQIVSWIIARTPDHHQDTLRATGRRAWVALSGFIRGTTVVALVDAIGIGIGLAIVGVPLVLPIAVLVFFGGFIPVIGAFVTGMLAVLVALADGGLSAALIVLAIVVAVQQIEANVLQPVIMRRAVALHPVVILGALTAGAALLGVIGAFIAVPIAAVVAAVGNEIRLRHEADQRPDVPPPGPDPLGPVKQPVETDQL